MLGLNLKHLNKKYLDILEKEERINQKYNQKPGTQGKKHRLHEDIVNDFLEDVDNYGFDRYHFQNYDTKKKCSRESRNLPEMPKQEEPAKRKPRPYTGVALKREGAASAFKKQQLRNIQSAKQSLREKEEVKVSALQRTMTHYTLKASVADNQKKLENMNKAEHKYWKNTSIVSDHKGLVRNRSARERLRIQSAEGEAFLKRIEGLHPEEQQQLGQTIDGREDGQQFVQKLNVQLISQRVCTATQKTEGVKGPRHQFIPEQYKTNQFTSFKDSKSFLMDLKSTSPRSQALPLSGPPTYDSQSQHLLSAELPKHQKRKVAPHSTSQTVLLEENSVRPVEFRPQELEYKLESSPHEVQHKMRGIAVLTEQEHYNYEAVQESLLQDLDFSQVVTGSNNELILLHINKLNLISVQGLECSQGRLVQSSTGSKVCFQSLQGLLMEDKSIYKANSKEYDIFYVLLHSDQLEGRRVLLLDRLVSARPIASVQDASFASQVLQFFLRLVYLQKEEELSLNYICTQSSLIMAQKKRVPANLLDCIHIHQHKRIRMQDSSLSLQLYVYQMLIDCLKAEQDRVLFSSPAPERKQRPTTARDTPLQPVQQGNISNKEHFHDAPLEVPYRFVSHNESQGYVNVTRQLQSEYVSRATHLKMSTKKSTVSSKTARAENLSPIFIMGKPLQK